MKKIFLLVLVSISGASVLALEILGTRILGPFYGVSIFLWSALISVALAALSTGYALGGRFADKGATLKKLSLLLVYAGIWIIFIPLLKYPILTISEPFGLRIAVLIASVILFFPPLTLLGMVSPYAIALHATSLDSVGKTAGNLYALSTFASVISALATGYLLIPYVGVLQLTLLIGGILLITGISGIIIEKKFSLPMMMFLVLSITLFIFLKNYMESSSNTNGSIAQKDSPYGELRVLDTENGRHLLIDGGIHTIFDTTTTSSRLHYAAVLEIPKYFFISPGKMLLIGLGGGAVAKNYAQEGWKVDAVEIDPDVATIAQRYFHLAPNEATIHIEDGRRFLLTSKEEYDVILLDAFGSSSIPFHLITKEVFELITRHLTKQGIFAVNIETVGWDDILARSVSATMKQAFHNVVSLPMAEPPNQLGNIILLGMNRSVELRRELERNYLDPEFRYGSKYQKVHAWDNQFIADTRSAPILTDNLNPVDIWSEEINFVARKQLHSYFEKIKIQW
ncbi:MAG: fused MFS/spermidine synthase [Ignavibacteriales bacterium]|nr:fused MFS/spermidine synthase [Ignavibacteriales bacterium]